MDTPAPADLVLTGGPVFAPTIERGRPATVAVRGTRIVAVGGEEVLDLVGPRTEVVDTTGRLVVPGFVDAHAHPVGGGLERGQCDLTGALTPAACAQVVAAHVASLPAGAWVRGGGWSLEAFPGGRPRAVDLDAVTGGRPACLLNRDHHGAWVNTAALRAAGIDAATPDPPDGRIEREADASPTGMLQEGAVDLVTRVMPPTSEDEELTGLLTAQALLHSLGVTAWQDAIVGPNPVTADPTRAYLAAARRGQLTARVAAALWWDRRRGTEQLPDLLAARDELVAAGLVCRNAKIMQDGIAENQTAAMLAPYVDPCGHADLGAGRSFLDPAALTEAVVALDAQDLGVHVHALGDRAVREALDAIAAARARGVRDTRPHLAHLQVVHPDDVPRFAALGVSANLQALWAAHEVQMDELTIPFLSPERASWQYPFGDLARAGAHLAAGSDWPVSDPDPWAALHVAVNRVAPDAPAGTPAFLPHQRLDLATALTAATAGSAHVSHLDSTGVLRAGALADLAVCDRDPFAAPAQEIASTRVVRTLVGGRTVHAADR